MIKPEQPSAVVRTRGLLLHTKLQRPAARAVITRERLFHKLQATLERKLTLVVAPAGFGKTTLIVDWLASQRDIVAPAVDVAWLSLDENDHDPVQFLTYVITALQKVEPLLGRGLPEAMQTMDALEAESIITALFNDVVAWTEEEPERHVLLVLDDYHVLDAPTIENALLFLINHLPPQLHIIMLSRIDPALPLARWRANGEIVDIRERDLRFSLPEAAVFFAEVMRLSLTPDELRTVYGRTEGWAAGLQLVAIAMQTADDGDTSLVAELSGTHRYIMDYLTDEVFQRQTAAIQQFLLETSVLNRLSAPLCDTLRNSHDSRKILEKLEHINLFIMPLDHQCRWYRYHYLFADILRLRSQQTMPAAQSTLHDRASRWYAQLAATTDDQAAVDEALYHAAAAGSDARIAVLLEQFGDGMWERGAHDKLRLWLSKLAEPTLNMYPRLLIFDGWLHAVSGQYAVAEAKLRQAEHHLTATTSVKELRGRIAATRAFVATFQGAWPDTLRHAQAALVHLADERSPWRASAAIAVGDAYALSGKTVPAGAAYEQALIRSSASANLYLSFNAAYKLATTQRQRGLLHEAYTTCLRHIAIAEQSGLAQTVMAGCLYALRGDILCEWNQLSEALAQTQHAIDAHHSARHLGLSGWIHLYRTRCLLAARGFDRAESTLQSYETLAQGTPPPWIAAPLAALRALLLLVRGNIAAAVAWSDERGLSVDDPRPAAREFEYLMFARILAFQQRFEDALAILARLYAGSMEGGRTNIGIAVRVVEIRIFQAQGRQAEAVAALAEALQLGQAGEYMRTFLDIGPALTPLLGAVAARGSTPAYVQRLLAVQTPAAAVKLLHSLPEQLSERELEVLHLITAGLKNQEIADKLVISLNTILYHTKNIYSKLGVSHRTQAVQRARELNLL